ncbi:hypothetical protein RQP46_005427 [Phenoliferia psychrophenolica]
MGCSRVAVASAFAFIFFLFGSLALFSKIYRRRKANEAPPPSWFGPHKSRDLYVSLLSLEPTPPQPILVAALLRRAVDDVKLIWGVRDQKAALANLLAKGQIGDDTWERFLAAEKELEAEIVEVVGEANAFVEGYGQQIFPLASEMATHEKWKDIYHIDMDKDRAEQVARFNTTTPTSLVLSPTSHLTPSSLTLYPSNPLILSSAASPPALPPAAATPAATPTPSAPSTPAKKTVASTTTTPKLTKTPPTPVPAVPAVPASLVADVVPPTAAPPQDDDDAEDDDDAAVPGSPTPSGASTPGTPGSAKKKKNKKKKSAAAKAAASPVASP